MTDTQEQFADQTLRSLNQTLEDLAAIAKHPEGARYLSHAWEDIRRAEKRLGEIRHTTQWAVYHAGDAA